MNVNYVTTGTESLNEQPKVNPIGQSSPIPLDVQRIIFENLKTKLPKLALVCKEWKSLADDKDFREIIRPKEAFGSREWKEYIGVDAGEEPLLPRRAYSDMETGWYNLTFIPEKVKKLPLNGKDDDRSIDLDSLEVINNLVSNQVKGNKMGPIESETTSHIQEKRKLEKPHWVMLSKKSLDESKTYKDKRTQAIVNSDQNTETKYSGLIDTAISVIMVYIRFGERNFIWEPDKKEYNKISVKDKSKEFRHCLGFRNSNLFVSSFFHVGVIKVRFALAKKSF